MVEKIFSNFGEIVSGPHLATWRGTNIKTGDRTLKMRLNRNIPQAFTALENKVRVTVRYRDQPQTCYLCGDMGHEKKDCTKETYATKVQRPTPQQPTDPDKSCFLPGGGGHVRLGEEEEGKKEERTKAEGDGNDEHTNGKLSFHAVVHTAI